ncbi:MAG: chemotaxis protein CheW [Treponema sp.]|nr:chemotaxis protein CheW [Treponema sp.]
MSDLAEAELIEEQPEYIISEKFLIFSILGKLYSFPSRIISEIALFDAVYPLPLMPSYVLGVINRYSVPYALFDLGILFNNAPSSCNKTLILKDQIDRIAFLIDDVTGIVDIMPENLFILERSSELNELTDAVSASFSWNGNDVFILDVNRILERVSEETA